MSALTTLIIVAMVLTFVENTIVCVTAILIYVRQSRANADMERRINSAIAEVKIYMKSPDILGTLKKEILKSIRGWFGGKSSAASRQGSAIAKWAGGIGALRELQKAKSFEEKALILAEYGMEKLNEREERLKAEQGMPVLSPEEFKAVKESTTTPEEYAKAFAEAVDAKGTE